MTSSPGISLPGVPQKFMRLRCVVGRCAHTCRWTRVTKALCLTSFPRSLVPLRSFLLRCPSFCWSFPWNFGTKAHAGSGLITTFLSTLLTNLALQPSASCLMNDSVPPLSFNCACQRSILLTLPTCFSLIPTHYRSSSGVYTRKGCLWLSAVVFCLNICNIITSGAELNG